MWRGGLRTDAGPECGADVDAHKTTYLTFSQPVSLPGVALGSGTYTFEIANPDTSADIVRVTSRDGSLVYFMGFTRAIARPNGMSRDQQRDDRRVGCGRRAAHYRVVAAE